MAIVPQEYLQAQRPVDQQLDVRNLLTALGQSYQQPQTSYVGLDPTLAVQSGQQTMNALKQQQQMLQNAQEIGVNQERAKFQDAMSAQQAWLRARDQKLQEAAAARAAASAGRSAETHELQKQLLKLKLQEQAQKTAFGQSNPELVYGRRAAGSGGKRTLWESKQAQNEQEAQEAAAAGYSPEIVRYIGRNGVDNLRKNVANMRKNAGTGDLLWNEKTPEEQNAVLVPMFQGAFGGNENDWGLLNGQQAAPVQTEAPLQTQQAPALTPEMQEQMQLFLNSWIDKKNKPAKK